MPAIVTSTHRAKWNSDKSISQHLCRHGFVCTIIFLKAFVCYCLLRVCAAFRLPAVFIFQPSPTAAWAGQEPAYFPASGRSLALRADTDTSSTNNRDVWVPGPAIIKSEPARRALMQLNYDPMLLLFDATVKEELALLLQQKQRDARPVRSPPGAVSEARDMLDLRRRILDVRQKDRLYTAAELIYVLVGSMFKHLEVPFIPPVKYGGDIRFSADGDQLRGLTELYSLDALELVRDHLYDLINAQARESGRGESLLIALFQAGQVYAMSALFGYHLRGADTRYQLEKLMWSFGGGKQKRLHDDRNKYPRKRRRANPPRWMELAWAKGEERADMSLKDYIASFGPEELQQIRSMASREAQVAMELQIAAVFGDLRKLKAKILWAVGKPKTPADASSKLQAAILMGKVESIRISATDLRRLILEAVGFGSALYDSERETGTVYELTPTDNAELDLH